MLTAGLTISANGSEKNGPGFKSKAIEKMKFSLIQLIYLV